MYGYEYKTRSRTDAEEDRRRLHRQVRGHLKALARANADNDEAARKLAVAYIKEAYEQLVTLDEEINSRR